MLDHRLAGKRRQRLPWKPHRRHPGLHEHHRHTHDANLRPAGSFASAANADCTAPESHAYSPTSHATPASAFGLRASRCRRISTVGICTVPRLPCFPLTVCRAITCRDSTCTYHATTCHRPVPNGIPLERAESDAVASERVACTFP